MHFFTLLCSSLALFSTTGWAGYVLEDDYFSNGGFFDNFDFFDSPDPTHGFVQYQSYSNALEQQLISNGTNGIRMGVDSTNNTPNGRPSVRITSKKSYSSGLIVLDLEHMPGGICGTWPAFWTVGPNWPNGGEIDIIEGVNDQSSNDVTLHTGPGCSISNSNNAFSGKMTSSTCTSSNSDNQGCQIASSNTETYGSGFNAANGGVYAMEFSGSGVNVYFFPRSSIPSDALSSSPNPSGWGTPLASFGGSACNFGSSFTAQQLVFDSTFCGDWAGQTWSSSSCASKASSCNAFVQNNPSAFVDAYWSVNALKVYSNNGQAETASPSPSAQAPASSSQAAATPTSVVQTMPIAQTTASPTAHSSTPVAVPVPTSSSSEFAPWVGPGGEVEGSNGESPSETPPTPASAPPAASTGGPGWFSNGPGGVVNEWKREEPVEVLQVRQGRVGRHLRSHIKRHGPKML